MGARLGLYELLLHLLGLEFFAQSLLFTLLTSTEAAGIPKICRADQTESRRTQDLVDREFTSRYWLDRFFKLFINFVKERHTIR